MAYHVTFRQRQAGAAPISIERLRQAISGIDNLSSSIFDDQTVNVNTANGQWLLSMFVTGDDWWSKTLDENQLDVFLAIADALDCDVEGDAGELYRLVNGDVEMVRGPDPTHMPPIWKRWGWYPFAFLMLGLLIVLAKKPFG